MEVVAPEVNQDFGGSLMFINAREMPPWEMYIKKSDTDQHGVTRGHEIAMNQAEQLRKDANIASRD